jgi:hypothetical protein
LLVSLISKIFSEKELTESGDRRDLNLDSLMTRGHVQAIIRYHLYLGTL